MDIILQEYDAEDFNFEYMRQFLKTHTRNQLYKGTILVRSSSKLVQKTTTTSASQRPQWLNRGGRGGKTLSEKKMKIACDIKNARNTRKWE